MNMPNEYFMNAETSYRREQVARHWVPARRNSARELMRRLLHTR